ncbi:MAG: hypothetical protein ACRCSP_07210 [Rhodoglobus sp.]
MQLTLKVQQLADRMLAHVAPQVEAAAACGTYWVYLGCDGGLRYRKKCKSGSSSCIGAPIVCKKREAYGSC